MVRESSPRAPTPARAKWRLVATAGVCAMLPLVGIAFGCSSGHPNADTYGQGDDASADVGSSGGRGGPDATVAPDTSGGAPGDGPPDAPADGPSADGPSAGD